MCRQPIHLKIIPKTWLRFGKNSVWKCLHLLECTNFLFTRWIPHLLQWKQELWKFSPRALHPSSSLSIGWQHRAHFRFEPAKILLRKFYKKKGKKLFRKKRLYKCSYLSERNLFRFGCLPSVPKKQIKSWQTLRKNYVVFTWKFLLYNLLSIF